MKMVDGHEFKPYADMPDYCVAELDNGETCNGERDMHRSEAPRRIEFTVVIEKIDSVVLDREQVEKLLLWHDPKAEGLVEMPAEELRALMVATLNDYPDSKLAAWFASESREAEILDVAEWEGRLCR